MVEPHEGYGIHWFRRDLRVAGNPGLQWSGKQHQGRVLGLFCFDKKFLSRPDFSVNRFHFFLDTLRALKEELVQAGSDLLVLDVGPQEAFEELFAKLKRQKIKLPASCSWNRDYEPFAIHRDRGMEKWFSLCGVPTHCERDHVLIEPEEIFKGDNPEAAYQVYTPYKRRWLEKFRTEKVQSRLTLQRRGIQYLDKFSGTQKERFFRLDWKTLLKNELSFPDHLEIYCKKNAPAVTIKIPPAGCKVALGQVRAFKKKREDYSTARDIPGERGTSGLSLYFKNGSLTIAQVICELDLEKANQKPESGGAKFLSELIWREFYYYILTRYPYVETGAFQTRYQNLKWENREDYFQAWKEGLTGYPIVDAGMRQLNTTGWMHNRVRMIVASFLTKDLLIDYRWGERYFMEKLLDGDLAPNNGGWQWAASTGCDAQPYFRIFNPKLQSEKFDPKGSYIKKYVPELAKVRGLSCHEPSLTPHYPARIVDHFEQKERALALFG